MVFQENCDLKKYKISIFRIVSSSVKLRLETTDELTILRGEVVEFRFKLYNDDVKNFKNLKWVKN